jgi:hypothetical protein
MTSIGMPQLLMICVLVVTVFGLFRVTPRGPRGPF